MWLISDQGFEAEQIRFFGSKYLLANGYLGYRGTLEEYTKEQFTGSILAGLYDQVGSKWREPVNAPNGLYVQLYCEGEPLSALDSTLIEHEQSLNLRQAVHRRRTKFQVGGNEIAVVAERFASAHNVHLLCLNYSFQVEKACEIKVVTGIDGRVWDLNGPHLSHFETGSTGDVIFLKAKTAEAGKEIVTAEMARFSVGRGEIECSKTGIFRIFRFAAQPSEIYSLQKYVAIYTANDPVQSPLNSAKEAVARASRVGYPALLNKHQEVWTKRWQQGDVIITGDSQAQLALRYSLYQLLAAAPFHGQNLSIPARGLSSQVYKGAVFWDTEMYMLPFFIYTQPEVSRTLINYRITTLPGAKAKAAEYGYRGAFYAWESQERGQDACTLFNVNDVFTGRPLRTYFRDKQIHISSAIVYGIWHYYQATGDWSVMQAGGLEVILECARFYLSHAYFKQETGQYELLDVTGPDEYHERVHNNAYTNRMAKFTADVALQMLEVCKATDGAEYEGLINRLEYADDLLALGEFARKLHLPRPDPETGLVEQFDGYFQLEDLSLAELRQRVLNANEYLGGPAGLATHTQVLKQADTILMLALFADSFSKEVLRANWDYYESRTEHGSTLSSPVHAILGARLGEIEAAYAYFLQSATLDLTGNYKQYVGDLFIGGTHLAANGGAWLSVIYGFAGLRLSPGELGFTPALPENWQQLKFTVQVRGRSIAVEISQDRVLLDGVERTSIAIF